MNRRQLLLGAATVAIIIPALPVSAKAKPLIYNDWLRTPAWWRYTFAQDVDEHGDTYIDWGDINAIAPAALVYGYGKNLTKIERWHGQRWLLVWGFVSGSHGDSAREHYATSVLGG